MIPKKSPFSIPYFKEKDFPAYLKENLQKPPLKGLKKFILFLRIHLFFNQKKEIQYKTPALQGTFLKIRRFRLAGLLFIILAALEAFAWIIFSHLF